MAIYHLHVKVIGRKSGSSAVASAAYRSGSRLRDERLDRSHDFSGKRRADRAEATLKIILVPLFYSQRLSRRLFVLRVVQPINLRSGEDPTADLDRCCALSRLGQLVQSDHGFSERWAFNRLVAVHQRRWLACINVDFIFAAHFAVPRPVVATW
jgi:hypothetical protein